MRSISHAPGKSACGCMKRNAQVTIPSGAVPAGPRRAYVCAVPPLKARQAAPYTGSMFHQPVVSRLIRFVLPATGLLFLVATAPAAHGWEHDGHIMINKLAESTLPADVPAFL